MAVCAVLEATADSLLRFPGAVQKETDDSLGHLSSLWWIIRIVFCFLAGKKKIKKLKIKHPHKAENCLWAYRNFLPGRKTHLTHGDADAVPTGGDAH